LAEARSCKSRWAEMGWDREKHGVPPKSPEANSYLSARCQNQKYAAETGESLKQAGTRVLEGQFQSRDDFQKAKEALSEMEILSQIAFLPFLSHLSLLLKEKYIRSLLNTGLDHPTYIISTESSWYGGRKLEGRADNVQVL